MSRDLNYDDRCALYEAIALLRSAEHGLILGIRASYASSAVGAIRPARADIDAALKALDAAEARLEPPEPSNVVPLEPPCGGNVGGLMR